MQELSLLKESIKIFSVFEFAFSTKFPLLEATLLSQSVLADHPLSIYSTSGQNSALGSKE